MRITGLTITSPDVAATQDAWRRLGTLDRGIEVTPGEGGLAAVVLGVDDVAATERLLQRRGLDGDAGGFDLGARQHLPRLAEKEAAGIGEHDPASHPVKEAHVVPRLEGRDRLIELRPRGPSPGHPVVNIEIITPHPGGAEVLDLPVGVLSASGDPRISNELPHDHPKVSRNQR